MSRDDAEGRGPGWPTLVRAILMVLVRVVVGWHFIHEGLARLVDAEWSTTAYVDAPGWLLAPVFRWVASSPGLLALVDFLNVWLPVLVGLGLILGCLTRLAGATGVFLFLVYFQNLHRNRLKNNQRQSTATP